MRLCLGKDNTNPLTYETIEKAQEIVDDNKRRIWECRDFVPISVTEYNRKYGAI